MHISFERLVIVTGTLAFGQMLHVGRPNVGDQERLFSW
jgi:hypothetical protein